MKGLKLQYFVKKVFTKFANVREQFAMVCEQFAMVCELFMNDLLSAMHSFVSKFANYYEQLREQVREVL